MAHGYVLRVLGLFSVIGGLILMGVQIWLFADPESFIATYWDQAGYSLLLLGIIGLYFAQHRSTGVPGLVSFVILILSMSLWLGVKWLQSFVVEDLLKNAPELMEKGLETAYVGSQLSLYALLLGILLFAVVTIWKGTLPRWGALLLIAAPLVELVPFLSSASQLVAGVGFVWLGSAVWAGKNQENAIVSSIAA